MKKLEEIGKLSEGRYIIIDGAACIITEIQKSKPGKHGAAKFRVTGVDLITNSKHEVLKTSGSNVEVPIIEKKDAQVLSISGDVANVMDLETYETFDIKIPEEFKGKVQANSQLHYWDILGQKLVKQVIIKH